MADRRFTRRQALWGVGGLSGLALADAFGIEPNWLEETSHDVPVQGLPSRLEGFKMAQITDAHLGELGAVEQAILKAVRAHDVQLVALTGDIVDSIQSFAVLREFCAALAETGTRIVATLGNWEHWGDVPLEDLRGLYAQFGVQLLVNEGVLVEGVTLAVTDDATAGRADIARAAQGVGEEARIMLTHSPAIFDDVPNGMPRFDLAVAGHTHGGQLRATSAVVPVLPPGSGRFVAGWYETPAGPAYVSRGTGTSIVPARFTCRPELPVFRLTQG